MTQKQYLGSLFDMKYAFEASSPSEMKDLKQGYLDQLIAPLDGMWGSFVDSGDHFSVRFGGAIVGYFVINAEKKLLQFHLQSGHDASNIFAEVLKETGCTGAFVATFEFPFLALCMDHQQSIVVNAFMYQLDQVASIEPGLFSEQTEFRLAEKDELNLAVEFCFQTLGANRDWLQEYLEERIDGRELFGLWQNGLLIATGECRPSSTQSPVADLGMIVSKDHRGQGIATNILKRLVQHCHKNEWVPICSTESENKAAQKSISRSGFVSYHRILECRFARAL